MGIRRKGSRPIVVDGTKYRWLTVGEDLWGVRLRAELYDQPAQKLESFFSYTSVFVERRENGSRLEPFWIISPRIVEQAIRRALELGWKPKQKGKDFFLSGDQVLETVQIAELKNYVEDFHSTTDART